MLVKQLVDISGSINGADWPGRGETIDLPDHVAADLAANGFVEIVAAKPRKVETATVEPSEETATAPKTKARRTSKD